jgi:DNA repair ATPase RecN
MEYGSIHLSSINNNLKKLGKIKADNGPSDFPNFSSFIETASHISMKSNGKFSLKELESSKLNSLEMSKIKQVAKRSKKRYTIEQQPCSSVFKQEGDYFFDCTNTKAPDGSLTEKEWCYIDSPEAGGKTWDYCSPIMDFDKIREANQKKMANVASEAKKLAETIIKNTKPAQEALDKLKEVKEEQQKISSDIGDFAKEINSIKNSIQNLFGQKKRWKDLEDQCADIGEKTQKKLHQKTLDEANNAPTLADPTDEFIKSEEAFNKQKNCNFHSKEND